MRLASSSVILTLAAMLTAAAQTPTPGTVAIGRIRGRVVRADTGAPLRGAQILLEGQPPLARRATTDDDGRYEFTDLPAGRFFLNASQGGYVTLSYGQRRPLEAGRPVVLGEAQVLSQVDFALPRGGVITGRITDEFGEPVTGAQIRVERFQYGPDGRRQLATFPLGLAINPFALATNDRGEFRVFGLMPGDYIVSARLQSVVQSFVPGGTAEGAEGVLPTYFPGTGNVSEAQPVRVGIAQEAPAHFTMVPGHNVRVSGTVVHANGRPAAGMKLNLLSVTATTVGFGNGGVVAADGSFSIGNVPPGDYFVNVRPEPGADIETATVPVSVGTESLTGVRISTTAGTTIKGRVEWAGSAGRPASAYEHRLRIRPIVADGRPALLGVGSFDADQDGTVNDDDTFVVGGLTGKVIVRTIGLPPEWTLKAVIADGKDITDTALETDRLATDAEFHVVMTDKITDVSGSVTNRGQPVPNYVVVVVPQTPLDGATVARRTSLAPSDQNGSFHVRALPPGRYVAAAVEGLEQGREWDPQFQKTIRASGTSFILAEGQALTLTLPLLP